jgi:uncharacterized protein YbaR (Trm112 family)
MKRDLNDLLVCPVCKSDLSLTVETEENDEVLTGTLRCIDSEIDYPIEDGIPNLLPREHAAAT